MGRGALSTGMAIGGLPLVQAGNTALDSQLLWYPVAVRVVSLLFDSLFAGSYLFLSLLCTCAGSQPRSVCVCYIRVNISWMPLPWESCANRISVPV